MVIVKAAVVKQILQVCAVQFPLLSHPCPKAGDSLIRSWGAFGFLLRFISLDSAIHGEDCARHVFIRLAQGEPLCRVCLTFCLSNSGAVLPV